MSQPFPLSAFASLADGQPIAAVQGVLVKLFDQKTGTSSAGAWALQNGEIEADGVTIPITFKDRDPLDKTLKGRTILISSSNDKGMKGVYCWDDTRNNATVRKIKVTPSATLDIISGGGGHAHQNHQQQQPQGGQTSLTNPPDQGGQGGGQRQQTQAAKPPKDQSKEDADFLEARKTINQIANLHLLCMLAVERYEAEAYKALTSRDMSEGQRQAAVASIFIKADREGLVRYMPVVDAKKDPRFQPSH